MSKDALASQRRHEQRVNDAQATLRASLGAEVANPRRTRVPEGLLNHRLLRADGNILSAGIASPDGVLRHDSVAYMEVWRRSVGPQGDFGAEQDTTGFYHHVEPNAGVFIDVGALVMDYTCPLWLMQRSSNFTLHRVPGNGMQSKFPQPSTRRPADRISAGFEIKCAEGWCMPAACLTTVFNSSGVSTVLLNVPSYWKHDPPVDEHSLRQLGFTSTLVFWAAHGTRRDRQLAEFGPRILVDLRRYGVTMKSYHNEVRVKAGANKSRVSHKHISCPPGHFYHVVQNGWVQPCACNSNTYELNCKQLSPWQPKQRQQYDQAGASLLLGYSRHGSLCANLSTCARDPFVAARSLPQSCPQMHLLPPAAGSSCQTTCLHHWQGVSLGKNIISVKCVSAPIRAWPNAEQSHKYMQTMKQVALRRIQSMVQTVIGRKESAPDNLLCRTLNTCLDKQTRRSDLPLKESWVDWSLHCPEVPLLASNHTITCTAVCKYAWVGRALRVLECT